MFGGNSNWRGPIWMPVNALIIRALLQYYALLRRRLHGRVPHRLRPADDAVPGRRGDRAPAGQHLPARRATAGGPCTAAPRSSRTIRTGAISSCSTSTSTATTAPGSAPATRPAGRASSPGRMHLFATSTAGASSSSTARWPSARHGSRATSNRAPRRRTQPMTGQPRYPSLYQINTRVWLTELSRALGRPATLDDMPDAELDRLAGDGVRLDLAAERLADRAGRAAGVAQPIRSGGRSSRRRCPTCARKTSPAPASRSPATRCIRRSAATRRWRGCASACGSAACG